MTAKDTSVVYLSPSSADRSKAEKDAVQAADYVIFGTHPRARTPEGIPENAVSVTAPGTLDGTPRDDGSVGVPERDKDGYGTYPIPLK